MWMLLENNKIFRLNNNNDQPIIGNSTLFLNLINNKPGRISTNSSNLCLNFYNLILYLLGF